MQARQLPDRGDCSNESVVHLLHGGLLVGPAAAHAVAVVPAAAAAPPAAVDWAVPAAAVARVSAAAPAAPAVLDAGAVGAHLLLLVIWISNAQCLHAALTIHCYGVRAIEICSKDKNESRRETIELMSSRVCSAGAAVVRRTADARRTASTKRAFVDAISNRSKASWWLGAVIENLTVCVLRRAKWEVSYL